MPTPSQNPPRTPISPAYSFSTCPDDILPGRTENDADDSAQSSLEDGITSRTSHAMPDAPASALVGQRQHVNMVIEEAQEMLDRVMAEGGSSRSTTLSPSPFVRSRHESMITPPPPEIVDEKPSESSARNTMTSAPELAHTQRRERVDEDDDEDMLEFSDDGLLEDEGMHPPGQPGFPMKRAIAISPSSFLRPGSRFYGTQQSERQVYDVQVEIKNVDMRDSTLCGYLRIQGLTEDHPTLTTFFEGEIIGSKYGFLTEHETWGASSRTDSTHWAKFGAFRPYAKAMRRGKGNIHIQDPGQRETIFMRWKERFLVPDHRVKTITGASFEGFYYICFNQMSGDISGIYFHSRSEKYQRLELKHSRNKGRFGAVEFR